MKAKSSSFNDFTWPNKIMMNFLGFWPRESDSIKTFDFFKSCRIILSIISMLSLLAPEILTLIIYWDDIAMITTVGCVTIQVIQLTFKMFYMLACREKFYKIYESVQQLWPITINDKERENFYQLPKLARRLSISLFCMYFSNVISFTSLSVLITLNNYRQANGSDYVRFLPFDLSYGIDVQRSPHFEIAFCCQIAEMIYGATGVAGVDSTMVTLVLHVSSQFRLLSTRFCKIEEEIESTSVTKLKVNIRQQIEHHKLILRVASDVRELLSPIIFVQLISSSLEICLTGYTVLTTEGSTGETAKFVIFFITILLQLTLWCWPGEVLIQESTAVGDVVCQKMSLYKFPTTLQRDLAFVMARAQKRCVVTALSFQAMSLSKLTDVTKTAASYFAVLRSMSNT